MPSSTHAIADLLDYEAQQAQDGLAPIQSLVQRDRAIGQSAPGQDDRRALLSHWLDEMRVQNPHLPGKAWVQTHRITIFGCVVIGLMSGSGFMKTLLAYDGRHPVNVLFILGFFVFLQIFFLALLVGKSAARKILKRADLGFFAEALLRWLRTNLRDVFRRESESTRASKEFFRRFHALHAPLEAAIASTFFQTFVLAFHLAAFATFLSTVAFSDLAFSWASTPGFSAEALHLVVQTIALPFAWIRAIVPDLSFIEATQYSRLESRYAAVLPGSRLPQGVDVGGWWPFLAACIFTYGVLPRVLLILWEKARIRRYLRRHAFVDHASSALVARLTQPAGVWATPGTSSTIPNQTLEESTLKRAAATLNDAPCLVLKWFGFPADDAALKSYLEQTFHIDVSAILEASGTDVDREKIREALTRMPSRHSQIRLVIASDPWEVPGEAAERLLRDLRSPPFDQLICLFAPLTQENGSVRIASDKDVTIWRQSLRSYRDPYAGLIVDLGASS